MRFFKLDGDKVVEAPIDSGGVPEIMMRAYLIGSIRPFGDALRSGISRGLDDRGDFHRYNRALRSLKKILDTQTQV